MSPGVTWLQHWLWMHDRHTCNTHVITPYISQQTPPNISWLIFKTIFSYHHSLAYENISLDYILLECLIFLKLLTWVSFFKKLNWKINSLKGGESGRDCAVVRAPPALVEDQNSIPSNHVGWLTAIYSICSRRIWHLWPPLAQRHILILLGHEYLL